MIERLLTISAMPVRWWEACGEAYCRWFHPSITRPVRGLYRCNRCLREYRVNF